MFSSFPRLLLHDASVLVWVACFLCQALAISSSGLGDATADAVAEEGVFASKVWRGAAFWWAIAVGTPEKPAVGREEELGSHE